MLLIGKGELADATHRSLDVARERVVRLHEPGDGEVREALGDDVDSVVVIAKEDVLSLRYALVVEAVKPGVPLVVTVYGQIMATQLERAVENVRVMSLADIAAPVLAAPCFDERLLSLRRTTNGFSGVRVTDGKPEIVPIESSGRRRGQRLITSVGSLVRPFEPSARILSSGLLALVLLLVVDTLAVAVVLDQPLVDAFYAMTKILVTVGPNPVIDQGPGWFKVFSAVMILATLGFTAVFTAGIIERILDRRLTTILGRRMVPRKNHVVVVGLGQVGLRLCLLLRDLGIPVLGIDSDIDSYNVARAKEYGLPVVIGRGGDRFLLARLSLRRARALAAVTGQEVENISIAVTAHGMTENLRTVLHAGRGEVTRETRSLFSVGVIRDIYRVGGAVLAAAALGSDASDGFVHEQTTYLITAGNEIELFEDGDGAGPDTASGAGRARGQSAGAAREQS
ncbi:MAG TPA: NAD-binding protein [Solirubrobacteraceae bacterium]|nr:NAD-binding protein [Solirubrobacteraceae bacterium]